MNTQPWLTEPNRVAFDHVGFPCIIKRGPLGAWCGYVGVPPNHPWHGRDDGRSSGIAPEPDVHGGITYGRACDGDPIGGVCHTPKPGEPEHVWWIGFDCAHSGDLVPGGINFWRELLEGRDAQETYRDQEYVTAETKRLAEQAREAGQ